MTNNALVGSGAWNNRNLAGRHSFSLECLASEGLEQPHGLFLPHRALDRCRVRPPRLDVGKLPVLYNHGRARKHRSSRLSSTVTSACTCKPRMRLWTTLCVQRVMIHSLHLRTKVLSCDAHSKKRYSGKIGLQELRLQAAHFELSACCADTVLEYG